MQTTSTDSLDWPLISKAVTVAALIRLSFRNDPYGIALILLLAVIVVAMWLLGRLAFAIWRRELLGVTSAVVAAIFIGAPCMGVTQWLPHAEAPTAQASRIESDPFAYRLRVASYKLADPKRTFIVFKPTPSDPPGDVETRVAYDETDTLAQGRKVPVIALARSQSPQDVAEFSACGWQARRVRDHYYEVTFSC